MSFREWRKNQVINICALSLPFVCLCSLAELETTSTVQKDDRIMEMKRSVEGKDNRIIELENRYYFESPCSMISFYAVGLVRAWHGGSWSEKIHPFEPQFRARSRESRVYECGPLLQTKKSQTFTFRARFCCFHWIIISFFLSVLTSPWEDYVVSWTALYAHFELVYLGWKISHWPTASFSKASKARRRRLQSLKLSMTTVFVLTRHDREKV